MSAQPAEAHSKKDLTTIVPTAKPVRRPSIKCTDVNDQYARPAQLGIFQSKFVIEMPQSNTIDLHDLQVLCPNNTCLPITAFCQLLATDASKAHDLIYPHKHLATELLTELNRICMLFSQDDDYALDNSSIESFAKYMLHAQHNSFLLLYNYSYGAIFDASPHKQLHKKLRHFTDLCKKNKYYALVITRQYHDDDLHLDGDVEHKHFHMTAHKVTTAKLIMVNDTKLYVCKYLIDGMHHTKNSDVNAVFYRLGSEPVIRHCPAPACNACAPVHLYSKITAVSYHVVKHPQELKQGTIQHNECAITVQFYRTFYDLPEMRLINAQNQHITIPLSFLYYNGHNFTVHWLARKRELQATLPEAKRQKH